MAGVQDDETHAFPHPALHALDDGLIDLAMRLVAPPQQHVGLGKALLGQAMLGHVEGCGRNLDIGLAVESLGQGTVNAVRIKAADQRVGLLVFILIPDQGAKDHRKRLLKRVECLSPYHA